MSDLQDLIATNAVRAYNECLERGVASERERIIKLLKDGVGWNNNDRCDCQLCANRRTIEQMKVERLVKRIEGEQK